MKQIVQLIIRPRNSSARFYLLIASPVLAIFLIIPFQLFYYGRAYASWSRLIPVGFMLAGFSLYFILAIIVWTLTKVRPSWAHGFSTALFWLGLYVLLSDVFAPSQISPLDGHPLVGRPHLAYTFLEAGLFLSMLVIALRFNLRLTPLFGVSTTAFLIIVSVAYGLMIAYPHHSAAGPIHDRHDTGIRGNVYHIVLDEFQSDVALLHLHEKNCMATFPGFTFFKNSIANYLFTYQSFHSYMTGTVFEGPKYDTWISSYKNGGLLNNLNLRGYRITKYTPAAYDFGSFSSEHLTSEEIFQKQHKASGYSLKDFVQIWFARVTPNFCVHAALAAGYSLGTKIETHVFGTLHDTNVPTSIPEGIQPYSAVLMIEKAIRDEVDRKSNGEYIYIHALLPHLPYVLDDQCKYTAESLESPIDRYYAQAGCALNLVSRYLAKLKALGRYDDATIIIQSDHGSVFGPIRKQGLSTVGTRQTEDNTEPGFLDNAMGWSEDVIKGRVMALLMIKPPRSTGPLVLSEQPAQLLDVYPTLVSLLSLRAKEEMPGLPLFDNKNACSRELSFYVTPPGEGKPPDVISVSIPNPQDLPNSALTVQGPLSRRPIINLPPKGISFNFGSSDEGGMWLTGFADKEKEGPAGQTTFFRWATGRKSRIKFSGLQLPHQTRLFLEFEIEPYREINCMKKMVIRSTLSSAAVIVKPGWNRYRVALDFTGGKDLVIDALYAESASPRSLGHDTNDARELAVRWKQIKLSYPQDRVSAKTHGQ
ncbi:MAG: Sulfatase [Syntrophorhabdus sp. PtaU1.Bin153]|nr:MAG: Sulfatase [Syntrophorhabdus sp. PtaU1.Bin153]